jgi:hypothetical protein
MWRVLAAAVLVVAVAGCGGEYKMAPVSGRVTLNGRPLANAWVNFQPIAPEGAMNAGPGSVGKTDAEGRYTLRVDESTSGAVVGNHRVSIMLAGEGEAAGRDDLDADNPEVRRPRPRMTLPGKYNMETILTCEVPRGGRDDANFDLTVP